MEKSLFIKTLLITIAVLGVNFSSNAQDIKVLTLDEALKIAEQQSPQLIQSRLSLKQSEESLNAQNAALKSQFIFNLNPLSYSKSRNYRESISKWINSENLSSNGDFSIIQPLKWTDGQISLVNSFGWNRIINDDYTSLRDQSDDSNLEPITSRTNTYSNNISIKLEQPLFKYNSKKMELKELEYAYENSKLNYAIQQLNIEKSVTQNFYSVYQNQKDLKIAKDEYKNQEANYEIVKNKVEAGLIAKEELFQAEVNFASSKSSLYTKEIALENAKDAFKQMLGMDLNEDFIILADVAINPIEVDMRKAIEYAMQQRMELRQKEINLENALFTLIRTKETNSFNGTLTANFGLRAQDNEVSSMYKNVTGEHNISLRFNIPVWDWGARKARIKAQEASIASTRLTNAEERKTIVLNVRKVCRNLPNLINQIEIAEQNEKNAIRTYELNVEKYKNGSITGMDLQQFQNQLTQKKQALTNALIQYKMELLNLKIQTLWDFENNKSYLPVELIK